MFNTVEKHQKLVKGIMITLGVAFAMWGIGGYLGGSGDDGYVAKVGSTKIYPRDIDNAMEQSQQQSQDKMQTLYGLINRQLLINNIKDSHMVATNAELQHEIANIPQFQDNGKFSLAKYTNFLHDRFMSAEQFQTNVEEQLLINQTLDFFKGSYFSSQLFGKKLATLLSRDRNVSTYIVDPHQFYSAITVSDKQINDYYEQNIAKFTLPEQVKLQYIVLNPDDITKNIQIPDAEIAKFITNHPAQTQNTQIDVSHILFTVPNGADAKTRAKIKAHAEQVLAQVRANPSSFAKLARQDSQDPGSAKNGGDLGFFAKGMMVKPFEDAAFKLKPGQISDLVETQYGYHILRLNAIKGNSATDMRNFAKAQLQKQQAVADIQAATDQLNNLTYTDPKTLDTAAKKLGLTLLTSDWVAKGASSGDFANPKIQKAIFTNDVIKNHNNSEVVDLDGGSHAVYRVIQDQPSQVQTESEVRNQIITSLKAQTASNMVYVDGQKKLNDLQKGKLQLQFSNSENVNLLAQSANIDPMSVKQIFSVSLTKLPAYTGSINSKGQFVIYKITGESIDPKLETQNLAALTQLDATNAMLDLNVYVESLRDKYSINYRIDRLKQQQDQQ